MLFVLAILRIDCEVSFASDTMGFTIWISAEVSSKINHAILLPCSPKNVFRFYIEERHIEKEN